jgi:hypothetical protein
MAAAIASGSLALQRHDALLRSVVEENLALAHRMFTSVMLSPSVYTQSANVSGTTLADSYPSTSCLDDLFWASTWLLRASIAGYRVDNASYYYSAARATFELAYAERDSVAASADYINNVAVVHAASITKACPSKKRNPC